MGTKQNQSGQKAKNYKTMKNKNSGDSFKFIGKKLPYNTKATLRVNQKVLIHPVDGISQATQTYEARIIVKKIQWTPKAKYELCLQGINENHKWHGAVLNDYGFNRLEAINNK